MRTRTLLGAAVVLTALLFQEAYAVPNAAIAALRASSCCAGKCRRAVDANKADASSILKGLQLVHDQLLTALKSQNVEVIAPEPGTPFDPAHHQALMQEPSDQYKEPTVTQLLQKGYMLHGRTLRPASVAVSKTS